jgi:hypothetical protein
MIRLASTTSCSRSRLVASGTFPDADAAVVLKERVDAILRDLGGPEDVSTVRSRLSTRFVELDAIADYLIANILRDGITTTKGRTRAAVSAFLHVVDRQLAIAKALGLERRRRDAGLSIAEKIAEFGRRQAERDKTLEP